jgi:hypothetical protein
LDLFKAALAASFRLRPFLVLWPVSEPAIDGVLMLTELWDVEGRSMTAAPA